MSRGTACDIRWREALARADTLRTGRSTVHGCGRQSDSRRGRWASMRHGTGSEGVLCHRGDLAAGICGPGRTRPPAVDGTDPAPAAADRPRRRDAAEPAIWVFAGVAAGADMLVAAGITRLVAGRDAAVGSAVFLAVFLVIAVAAVGAGTRLFRSLPSH